MKYLALLLLSYLALTLAAPNNIFDQEWISFKGQHQKVYDTLDEDTLRRAIFALNKQKVDQFNLHESETAGYTQGVNHLSDWTEAEFARLNGLRAPEEKPLATSNSDKANRFVESILKDKSREVPDEVDWRKEEGRVSPVKDQGSCSSCWAFATTGVLEGQEKPRSRANSSFNRLVSLSEQNLVDCVKDVFGCRGGNMGAALQFVKAEGGIDDEDSYPYVGLDGKCKFRKDKVAFTDDGYAILPEGDEEKLKEVVAKFGPVSAGIDADHESFKHYNSGVYYNLDCKNKLTDINHAVLVVGYGTDPKLGDHWIVKNSWSEIYGDNGYVKIARNRNNHCGIATMATIPIF